MSDLMRFSRQRYWVANFLIRHVIVRLAGRGVEITRQDHVTDGLHHAPACGANHWHHRRPVTSRCTCGAEDQWREKKGELELWYFKDTGKFYSSARQSFTEPNYKSGAVARRLLCEGDLPGLVRGARFHLVVIAPDGVPRLVFNDRDLHRCHSGQDGDCSWSLCPQNRDGEPVKSGRHCPLDYQEDE